MKDFTLDADWLARIRAPLKDQADCLTPDQFFADPAASALYRLAQDPAHTRAALQTVAAILPGLHPNRASILALMCGALVEDDADPTMVFAVLLQLLQHWLIEVEPYCAAEIDLEDEEVDEDSRQAWITANERLENLPDEDDWRLDAMHEAIELLVLPMMTMVLRAQSNHQAFIADDDFLRRLHDISTNGSLPFEQLHYLWLAACMSYEDEVVVVLPASGTGLVISAHAVNNSFHAFSLLQQLLRQHAAELRLHDLGPSNLDREYDHDKADFLWLQAPAYAGGELVNEMHWAWGEAPLRHNVRKQGRVLLIGVAKEDACKRSWSGFTRAQHDAQNPHVDFKRYLTPEEVAAYLA